MRASAIFAVAASAAALSPERAFEEFVTTYKKVYASAEERAQRFEIFAKNFALVEAENAKANSYKLAINVFADLPLEEFKGQRLGYSPPAEHDKGLRFGAPFLGTDLYSGGELPESVDWFKDGAVTPIKDQGSCGSCWTFSTSGALEGAWQIASGSLVAISEQQLVDCATEDGLSGCSGGMMDPAFTYLEKHAVCSEESYPYATKEESCKQDSCTPVIPKGGVVGFKDVPADDTKALMEAVAQQPVSTAVQAGQSAFQMYSSGVLTTECTPSVDHAVLIVGYGTEDGVDYWKIKNSWGSAWGEEGFIRLARGHEGAGECGVKTMPSYPVVQAAEAVV